ncbi:MAG: hypothetical protein J0I06_04050 [Planctomycetes bacterium]|nr:hypothetical protein [Planctomycetota bacterium]
MGVALFYQTTKPVVAAVKRAILADAARLNGERGWWCESIIFFEVDRKKGPTPITGDTKLFRSDAHEDDDDFMAHRDAAFIVQQLVRWSREHGVDWTLEMAGTEVGTITNGQVQPPGLFQWDQPESAAARRRAARVTRKYASQSG